MRRRVFHLIKGLGRGGAEVLLEQMLRFGDSQRYEYAFGYFLPWKDALSADLRAAGAEVVCFEARGELAMAFSAGRVARHLRAWRADLLHAHLPLAGVVGRWAGRRAAVPVVYTEHNVQERYRWLTRRSSRATWGWQERVIAVSDRVAGSIAASGAAGVPVVVVPNGVDVDRFQPRPGEGAAARRALGIAGDAPVVGTVAVFRPQKALHDWLAAAERVAQRRPDARFLLVGDGPLREALVRGAASRGLARAVVFAGLQQDVRPYLAAMDVFLMTSIHEGLPVALLEAMAMGRPAVVTPVGGIPEIVEASVNGQLVPVGEPAAAADAALALLADPARARALAAAGRRTVAARYGAGAMVRAVEAVYDEVLAGR